MTDTVTTIAAELEAAEKDVALLERLNSAKKRVAQLTKDLEAAKAKQSKVEAARAADAEAARRAEMAKYSNIRVVGNAGTGPLHRDWKITFTAPAWDRVAMQTRVQDVTVPGFHNLWSDYPMALRALIELHPDRVPVEIANLAPGDLYDAFDIFLNAQSRGHLPTRSAA